jgi:hypothetical protein
MIKKHKYSLIVLVAICGIVCAACKQQRQICLTPKIASFTIESMHKTSGTDTGFVDTALPAAVFVAVTDSGKKDSFQYTQSSLFTISLSPLSDSCKWAFKPDTLTTIALDTLTFYYKRNLQFLSNACGYTYFYSLDSAHTTHKSIDSFHITNTSVTNDAKAKHLQIFIHPDF